MSHDTVQTSAAAREFLDLAFNEKQPAEAARRYLGPVYRQHNPMAEDGAEAFIGLAEFFNSEYPDLRVEFKRSIAEGELAMLHNHVVLTPGTRGQAVVEIFRFEDGKIVEHWDVIQEVPEEAKNANGVF
jgi:predicted SnoaL-like aldol condensation-catalyzing enzyme